MPNPLRNLPSVNELLDSPQVKQVVDRFSHNVVVDGARRILDEVRGQVKSAGEQFSVPSPSELAGRLVEWVQREERPRLRPVINATGILLHTGLGRAPLSQQAIEAMQAIGQGYANLEVDLHTGERSQRIHAVEDILCEITGAEAAAVVNNCAGATVLTVAALASGHEVIVSRGQLIEIGGSFRLPEVMSSGGATLREVGTTNKTRLSDYADAISEQTGALMRVHPSNYVVVGFTAQPTLEELVSLGRRHRIPVIDDVGSGALFDYSPYGLTDEPVVPESLKAGADVVLFSGDKLVGGPQCGIIVGKKKQIDKISGHPLMRAYRVDKLTLAGLAATLRLYRDRKTAEQSIPVLAMLSTSVDNLRLRAERLAPQLEQLSGIRSVTIMESQAMLGGGSVPTQQIPSISLAINPESMNVDRLAEKLRLGETSLFGRVQKDRFHLDLRTIPPHHDVDLIHIVGAVTETAQTREGNGEKSG